MSGGFIGVFIAGTLVGSAATFITAGGRPGQSLEGFDLAELPGAIILYEAQTKIGRTIDYGTGKKGFSHSCLFLGHLDIDGMPLLVDIRPWDGVHVRRADTYEEYEYIVIVLSEQDTTYAREEAEKLLRYGAGYRGGRRGLTCAEMVMACLPMRYRREMLKKWITPNDIAEYFRPEVVERNQLKSKLMR